LLLGKNEGGSQNGINLHTIYKYIIYKKLKYFNILYGYHTIIYYKMQQTNQMLNMLSLFQIKPSVYNAEIGLFTTGLQLGATDYSVPFCFPQVIVEEINKNLAGIEGIRYEYDAHKKCWKIAFGTESRTNTVTDFDMREKILHSYWCGEAAAKKARNKFPHLENNTNVNFDYYVSEYGYNTLSQTPNRLRWCEFTIQLLYNERRQCITVEPTNRRGYSDAFSFYHLFEKITCSLFVPAFLKLVYWTKRKNFLMLTEGIPGKNIRNSHILKYLCEELAMREICENI